MRISDNNIFDARNQRIGYIEDDKLFVIDKDGYAIKIGTVAHQSEALALISKWFKGK